MSVTDSPTKRKNGRTLTLIAEGSLVDRDADPCYNTYINKALGNKMFAFEDLHFFINFQLKDVR